MHLHVLRLWLQVVEHSAEAVELTLYSPDRSKPPCTIVFGYNEDMRSVLARCRSAMAPKGLLEGLFPGDNGEGWPHGVSKVLQLGQDAPKIVAKEGKPYRCASRVWWTAR